MKNTGIGGIDTKRTLLALLLALTLLLTCAVPVFAEGTPPTLNLNDTVTAGQPFMIDLGDDYAGVVHIDRYISDNDWTSFTVKPDDSWVGLEIQGQSLIAHSNYVNPDYPESFVGMELKKIIYNCKTVEGGSGDEYYYFLICRCSDGTYEIIETYKYDAEIQITGDSYSIVYKESENDESGTSISFDPNEGFTEVHLTFEKEPESLPSTPLQPGESYYHNVIQNENFWWFPSNPLYAAVRNEEGYKVYNAAELGLNMIPIERSYGPVEGQTSLAKLTVQAGSALDGARFTGQQYSAQTLTFTSSDGSQSIELLVYLDGDNYKCFNEQGIILDLVCKDSQLMLNESYTAPFPEDWSYDFYPLDNMVLFFDAAGMADPDEPVVPPAPSYPKYYPDYDEPTTVQPAPEAPAAEADEYVVVCRRLNVRRTPSTRYTRIGRLNRGDVVNVVEWVGKWAKIEWNGGTAYVHGNYISPVD